MQALREDPAVAAERLGGEDQGCSRNLERRKGSIAETEVKALRGPDWTMKLLANLSITAFGVHAVCDEGHRLHGKVLAQKRYDPQLRERHLGSLGESSDE